MSAGIQERSRDHTCAVHGEAGTGVGVLSCERVPARALGSGLATEPNLRETADRNDQVKP